MSWDGARYALEKQRFIASRCFHVDRWAGIVARGGLRGRVRGHSRQATAPFPSRAQLEGTTAPKHGTFCPRRDAGAGTGYQRVALSSDCDKAEESEHTVRTCESLEM